MNRGLSIGALVGLVGVAGAAQAYVPSESQWNPGSLPISYYINLGSAPPELGATAAQAAIEGGFASWSAPGCTRWAARDAGNSSLSRADTGDGEHTMVWISGSWPSELGDVGTVLGVTTPVWNVGGYFVDADIQFNNVGFTWTSNGNGGTVDAQSIATHEEGHFLGLDHTGISSAVMFFAYQGGQKRTLQPDDVAGVCAVYPSGGPVPDAGMQPDQCGRYASCAGCTPVDGCGWCESAGACVSGGQSGPSASSCGSGWRWLPAECGGASDPCAAYSGCADCTQQQTCGWCGASSQCASGRSTGPNQGTCAASWGWQSTDCAAAGGNRAFGEPCANPRDCSSGYCATNGSQNFCSRACAGDCTCPRGYACRATADPNLSLCVLGMNSCPGSESDAGFVDTGVGSTEMDGAAAGDGGGGSTRDSAASADPGSRQSSTRQSTRSDCACTSVGSNGSPLEPAALGLALIGLLVRARAARRRPSARSRETSALWPPGTARRGRR